jgi:hypothetical protein
VASVDGGEIRKRIRRRVPLDIGIEKLESRGIAPTGRLVHQPHELQLLLARSHRSEYFK